MYVTHDQTEAMTLGDRIVVMKDGMVQQIGTPQEVYNHPSNLFVAGFIGTPQMNFYDAELVREGDAYTVRIGDAIITPSPEKQAALAAKGVCSQSITLGVRPEDISLTDEAENVLTGTVDVTEMMGSSINLHVSVYGHDSIIVAQTTSLEGKPLVLSPGEQISFSFGGGALHFFSKETDENLE